jgi:threonine dehydratase
MINLKDIEDAQQRIKSYVQVTPVLTNSSLDKQFNKELFFKAEHLQKTGSFKARGALNAPCKLAT